MGNGTSISRKSNPKYGKVGQVLQGRLGERVVQNCSGQWVAAGLRVLELGVIIRTGSHEDHLKELKYLQRLVITLNVWHVLMYDVDVSNSLVHLWVRTLNFSTVPIRKSFD